MSARVALKSRGSLGQLTLAHDVDDLITRGGHQQLLAILRLFVGSIHDSEVYNLSGQKNHAQHQSNRNMGWDLNPIRTILHLLSTAYFTCGKRVPVLWPANITVSAIDPWSSQAIRAQPNFQSRQCTSTSQKKMIHGLSNVYH